MLYSSNSTTPSNPAVSESLHLEAEPPIARDNVQCFNAISLPGRVKLDAMRNVHMPGVTRHGHMPGMSICPACPASPAMYICPACPASPAFAAAGARWYSEAPRSLSDSDTRRVHSTAPRLDLALPRQKAGIRTADSPMVDSDIMMQGWMETRENIGGHTRACGRGIVRCPPQRDDSACLAHSHSHFIT